MDDKKEQEISYLQLHSQYLIPRVGKDVKVYVESLRCKTTIIINWDITKVLRVGNMVAINHPE